MCSLQNKTIQAVLKNDLPPMQDFDSCEIVAPVFEEFNVSSMKNRSLSVQEMFVKHLIQLFGVSVEKASNIIKQVICLY